MKCAECGEVIDVQSEPAGIPMYKREDFQEKPVHSRCYQGNNPDMLQGPHDTWREGRGCGHG